MESAVEIAAFTCDGTALCCAVIGNCAVIAGNALGRVHWASPRCIQTRAEALPVGRAAPSLAWRALRLTARITAHTRALPVEIQGAHSDPVLAAELSPAQAARLKLGDQTFRFLAVPAMMAFLNNYSLFAHARSPSHRRTPNQMEWSDAYLRQEECSEAHHPLPVVAIP